MAMSPRRTRWLLAALVGAAVVAAFALRDRCDLASVEAAIGSLGPWGPVAFVALFATGTVLFLPGSVFGLAGGALFGPLWGTVLNLAGGTLGAFLAFLVARHIAAGWVARRAGGRLRQVVEGVEAEGWRFVALVRLVPAVPFNLANYALGLTRIPAGQYLAATAICMLPGTAAFAWLGYAGRGALAGDDAAALRYGLFGLAGLAAIAFLPRLVRRLRAAPETRQAEVWLEPEALAAALADRGAPRPIVVDVRGRDEFEGPLGHIPGAMHLPVDALVADPARLAAFRGQELALVCRTDRRSVRGAAALRAAGFGQVMVLRGGMERWNTLGLATARGDGDEIPDASAGR